MQDETLGLCEFEMGKICHLQPCFSSLKQKSKINLKMLRNKDKNSKQNKTRPQQEYVLCLKLPFAPDCCVYKSKLYVQWGKGK